MTKVVWFIVLLLTDTELQSVSGYFTSTVQIWLPPQFLPINFIDLFINWVRVILLHRFLFLHRVETAAVDFLHTHYLLILSSQQIILSVARLSRECCAVTYKCFIKNTAAWRGPTAWQILLYSWNKGALEVETKVVWYLMSGVSVVPVLSLPASLLSWAASLSAGASHSTTVKCQEGTTMTRPPPD